MSRVQAVRTFLPGLVGVLLARLVAAVPAVAAAVDWFDSLFAEAGWVGVTTLGLVQAAIVAGVIVGYQWVVQRLGDRLPRVEAALLGSAARPEYVPRYGVRSDDGV